MQLSHTHWCWRFGINHSAFHSESRNDDQVIRAWTVFEIIFQFSLSRVTNLRRRSDEGGRRVQQRGKEQRRRRTTRERRRPKDPLRSSRRSSPRMAQWWPSRRSSLGLSKRRKRKRMTRRRKKIVRIWSNCITKLIDFGLLITWFYLLSVGPTGGAMSEVQRHGHGASGQTLLVRWDVWGGWPPVHPEWLLLPGPPQDGPVGGSGWNGPKWVKKSREKKGIWAASLKAWGFIQIYRVFFFSLPSAETQEWLEESESEEEEEGEEEAKGAEGEEEEESEEESEDEEGKGLCPACCINPD